jgi:hypothetical protein
MQDWIMEMMEVQKQGLMMECSLMMRQLCQVGKRYMKKNRHASMCWQGMLDS